ncbi:asparagine synthetase domain-containing protein CG17486 [Contarinia nasturtii]|uniref:asparagine synthetase domain-containing protein CG17486 n=1 Tax=Contarinia nasturtii TaxID=265458 RepID=UPI0012D463E4|nr:asparagine synthetase domain-containing protein CG17486 [Contarinia nasturtii]
MCVCIFSVYITLSPVIICDITKMCGIYCCLQQKKKDEYTTSSIEINELTKQLLENRGPNQNAEITLKIDHYEILFSGFVLWQQGANKLCPQPHSYKNHIILINGDIFTKREDLAISDTEWLTLQIDKCKDESELLDLFRRLKGPFSIIYYNLNVKKLYFLRDIFGRQSFLLAKTNSHNIILSSVLGASLEQHYTKCIELNPLGVFCIDLMKEDIIIQLNPWQPLNEENFTQTNELQDFLNTTIELRPSIGSIWLELDNISYFYNFQSILDSYEIQGKSYVDIFEQLLKNNNVVSVCDEVILRLEKSLLDRTINTPYVCKECLQAKDIDFSSCCHARIGILFSGGIDCTILAVLMDKVLNPSQEIDLINVSFEKINRSGVKNEIDYNTRFNTPDRVSAKNAVDELKQINPERKWNLVEVNVSRNELSDALKTRIRHLVFPLRTVLDESLGCVLWFGARGKGIKFL